MKKVLLVAIILSCFAFSSCILPHEHSFSAEYSSDNARHWQETLCGHDDVVIKNDHEYVDGVCSVCGYSAFTFEKIENKNEYRLTSFNASVTKVKVPSRYNGYQVTEIGDRVFYGNANVTSIEMQSGIVRIGDMAFASCPSLKAVTIPNSIISVGESLFEGSGVETIYYSGIVGEWNDTMPSDGKWANGLEHYTVECLNGTINI